MPTDLYGAAGASNGTFFYAAGGYSFSSGTTLAVVNRFDPVANTWTPMMNMPQAAIMGCAAYYPTTNKIYVFGGEDAVSGVNYNITRIYDIASNTWTTGTNMPDVRSFSACGYVPATGKIYLISGYNTGQVTSAQPNTWSYDPVANTWTDLTGTIPFPHPAGGFGFGTRIRGIRLDDGPGLIRRRRPGFLDRLDVDGPPRLADIHACLPPSTAPSGLIHGPCHDHVAGVASTE